MRYIKSPTAGNVVASIVRIGSDDSDKKTISASEISVIQDLVSHGCDETEIRNAIQHGIAMNIISRNNENLEYRYD